MKTKRGSACFTFCFVPAASKFATKTTLTEADADADDAVPLRRPVKSQSLQGRSSNQWKQFVSTFSLSKLFPLFFLHRYRSRQSRCNRAEVWTFFLSDDEIFDDRWFIWKIVFVLIRKLCVCSFCIVSLNSEWNQKLRTKPCCKMLAKISFSLLTGIDDWSLFNLTSMNSTVNYYGWTRRFRSSDRA